MAQVYKLMANFPNEEKFALSAQIRRAIVFVPSNLAEGCGRIPYKEKIHFAQIAYGSLMETFCQLQIALDLGYISETDIACIKTSILFSFALDQCFIQKLRCETKPINHRLRRE